MKHKLIKSLPTLLQTVPLSYFSLLWTLKLQFNNLSPLSWIKHKKTKHVSVKQFSNKFLIRAIGTCKNKFFPHLKKNIFEKGKTIKTILYFLLFQFSYSIYKNFLK